MSMAMRRQYLLAHVDAVVVTDNPTCAQELLEWCGDLDRQARVVTLGRGSIPGGSALRTGRRQTDSVSGRSVAQKQPDDAAAVHAETALHRS